jgi:hypothetical protein
MNLNLNLKVSNSISSKNENKDIEIHNANFPMSDNGRVYHVEVKRGEGMH